MRSSVVRAALCAAAVAHATEACAPGIDLHDGDGSVEPPASSLGVATSRASEYGWQAVRLNDFNFDGMGDILWSNPEQGLMAVWLMEGTQLLGPGPVIPGPIGQGWEAVNAGDFNFDGMSDVLWMNAEQNLIAVWLMNGSQLLAPGPVIPGPIGRGWEVRPGTDVSFDNMGDVLWYDVGTNQAEVWLMEGTQLIAPGPVILGPYDG
ncbi:FG-GAP repeat domain-containing protein [Sorangium sp. So ce1151]|uniref:FG-GAP repeat domain-containing protein n=1 Tax=Sorangium sp. So ce1151 TaxID=3133332 RepID=UPI003F602B08